MTEIYRYVMCIFTDINLKNNTLDFDLNDMKSLLLYTNIGARQGGGWGGEEKIRMF